MRHAWVSRVGMVTLFGVLVFLGSTYTASGGKPVPPPAPAVPRVVDANSNMVGQVVGTAGESPFVALNIPGYSFVVGVTPNNFIGNAPLSFTTADCTGQAYFDVVYSSRMLFPPVNVFNGTLYGPRTNSTPVAITYQSFIDTSSQHLCRNDGSSSINAYPADPIIDLSAQFTQPYRFVYN